MAFSQTADGEGRARRRRRSVNELEDGKVHPTNGTQTVAQDLGRQDVRRTGVERIESSSKTSRTSVATTNMTTESHATIPSIRSGSTHRRRRRHHGSGDAEPGRRTTRESADHVYRGSAERPRSSRVSIQAKPKVERHTSESDGSSTGEEPVEAKPRKKKTKIVYITVEESVLGRHKERKATEDREVRSAVKAREDSISRSKTSRSRGKSTADILLPSPPKRSASTRDLPSQPRPTLRRSNTTTSHTPSVKNIHALPAASTTSSSKRGSFLGSFFGPSLQPHHEPERLVECLTCLSDDIPRSKSAKLKCGHRMCHSCLRRIFKLSVTDPQHMPPKCCTSDHIPLKHVERLFDLNFKINWNKKYQEYSTKNRIYCPGRRCGEWIKPGNIHKEDGKKYGKCGRCKLKVCCLCNGKWHGAKECPKDEATNALLEAAKQAGWQRCYSCKTLVELKEGCNHMTCRCTAQFCMICGLKWKSCNCPWFNYEAVEADRVNHEADRLNHMRVPENPAAPEERPNRIRRARPDNYTEEMNRRRQQERDDEELARRLQRVGIDGDADDGYQGGIGNIHGIGNGAGHFMNQNYVRAAHNILTGNYDQATAAANYVMGMAAQARGRPPRPSPGPLQPSPRRFPPPPAPGNWPAQGRGSPPPVLRRHTMREQVYNSIARPTERVVPRRTRTDYASEAAVHAPAGMVPPRVPSSNEPRPSVLAGLGGSGRYANRVGAWRAHVEPIAPAEGVLSMP